nr:hypothetical protein [Tanacetum cinerariifolium]
MAGISGLTATVDAIQTGKKTLLLGLWDFDNISPSPSEVYIGLLELVCCVGSGEKSGDVTEEGEKRTAGISGLNATVLAIQTGKKTLLLGLWDFDNISPSAADIMQALKESKKTSKRQPGFGGSSKGTGTIPGVLDKSKVIFATSSEGTGNKLGVPDEEKDITEENFILEWGLEQESKYSDEDLLDDKEKDDKEGVSDDEGDDHISATKDTDDEDDETESDEDEIYKHKICVHKDEYEEMLNNEAKETGKGDAEVSDAAKVDAEKTEEAKDDSKKAELLLTSSSLSISLGFGYQFLKLSSDTSLVCTVKDTIDTNISSLLDIKIQYEVPHIQSTSVFRVPVALRFAKLEKDVSELKNVDHSAATIATLKS